MGSTVKHETIEIDVGREHPISCNSFIDPNNLKKILVISSATAVPQGYYLKFAEYCAGLGLGTYTFDYSCIGDSGSSAALLRANKGGCKGWGSIDQAGVVEYVAHTHPDHKIVMLTHSIGGQLLGFNASYHRLERVLMLASQSGYWNIYEGWHKWKILLFWQLFLPLPTKIAGYYPGKTMGLVGDLPKGMALEWRKWGMKKDYFMHFYNPEEYFFDKFKMPMKVYSFPKDPFASKKGVDWLASTYKNAQIERVHYNANGGKEPRHFGFFKKDFKQVLWEPSIEWLLQ